MLLAGPLAALGLLAVADGSGATDPALAVLEVGHEDSGSDVLHEVRALFDYRLGVRLVPDEEIEGSRLAGAVGECGANTACLVERLRARGFRFGLIVANNLSVSPALLSMSLIDAGPGVEVAHRVRTVDLLATPLGDQLRAMASELFDAAKLAKAGRLVLEVKPAESVVAIDGAPPATPPGALGAGGAAAGDSALVAHKLAPGEHQVRVLAPGFSEAVRTVALPAGAEVRLSVALDKEETLVGRWWFWTALGAVVLGSGAAAAYAITPRGANCACFTDASRVCNRCP
jgi:hypothetical protein